MVVPMYQYSESSSLVKYVKLAAHSNVHNYLFKLIKRVTTMIIKTILPHQTLLSILATIVMYEFHLNNQSYFSCT